MAAPSAGGFELVGPATPPAVLLRELWRSRSLLVILARKDFYVRYRRTVLGLVWAVALPLVQALVLAVVFTHVVRVSSAIGRPHDYVVFLYAALVPWNYLIQAVPAGSTAIVDNVGLAGKIYFPRALLAGVVAVSNLYPLAIGIGLLAVLSAVSGSLGAGFPLVVVGAAMCFLLALSSGLLLSAAHVYFRDVRYIVTAILSVGFYLTPIIYPLSKPHGAVRDVLSFGPAAGPIEVFRQATVGAGPGVGLAVVAALGWCVLLGGLGFWLQCRRDRVFTDLL